jgi:hypothetical protein
MIKFIVMNTTINVRGDAISIDMKEHIIRIKNNDALTNLLACDTEAVTDELVLEIKKQYQTLFNKDFNVADKSIAVEIWAHVYIEKFADAVATLTSINFIDTLAEKIIERCEIIDIGESGYDDNRFVWDNLTYLKSTIAKLLPKKAM